MSFNFMLVIAACYLFAAGSFAYEGKLYWMGVSLCWGLGNLLLAIASTR